MKSEYHILNLGAGVQSTTLYLMFMRGEILPQIDCAIFADTQDEPGAVYRHLEWLKSLGGPEIMVRTRGRLGDDLTAARQPGKRATSLPGFTAPDERPDDWVEGRAKRQCSSDYKTEVVERCIKNEILGSPKGARWPKGVRINSYFGISLDEAGRSRRLIERFSKEKPWGNPKFPLLDRFMTRPDCLTYMADKVPHQCPRSACVFCPYHNDIEWYRIKHEDPEAWARAVEIDRLIREPGRAVSATLRDKLYLHRSCQPLGLVQFDTRPTRRDLQMSMSFAQVCEGVCGV